MSREEVTLSLDAAEAAALFDKPSLAERAVFHAASRITRGDLTLRATSSSAVRWA